MLSVNQLAASIKLTDAWKTCNIEYYSLKLEKNYDNLVPNNRSVRSHINRVWNEDGRSIAAKEIFSRNTAKLWNQAPISLQEAKTLTIAKKHVYSYCRTLPI